MGNKELLNCIQCGLCVTNRIQTRHSNGALTDLIMNHVTQSVEISFHSTKNS